MISADRAGERRRWTNRPSRPEPYIFFTACHQPAMVLARDLRLPTALPCDTDPLHELFFFTTVAAAPNGDYLAAGRDNGDVLVWERQGRRYERVSVLRCNRRIIRVLLHVPPSRDDQGFYLYVAAESENQLFQREGDQACEISSWRFPAGAPSALIAKTPTHDVSDIALGRYRRTVVSSHETRLPVDRYLRPAMYGLVSSHEHERGAGPHAAYYERFPHGVLSVAVTSDLSVAFARTADRITRVEPKRISPAI